MTGDGTPVDISTFRKDTDNLSCGGCCSDSAYTFGVPDPDDLCVIHSQDVNVNMDTNVSMEANVNMDTNVNLYGNVHFAVCKGEKNGKLLKM